MCTIDCSGEEGGPGKAQPVVCLQAPGIITHATLEIFAVTEVAESNPVPPNMC